MATYLDSLQREVSRNGRTANGAIAHSTTTDAVLDFFSTAGAMRNGLGTARDAFRKAYAENKQLALRTLFYLRDIRGGQGERDVFRSVFTDLRRVDPEVFKLALKWIPEYGRWDDLLNIGVSIDRSEITPILTQQFAEDEANMREGRSVSLLAKWLPSENASSQNSKVHARQLAEAWGMSNKEYRKRVVALRQHIGLLEQQMSENAWGEIDYGKIPSQAGRKHSKAFKRHDDWRYNRFLDSVLSGETKMNAGTVFTYEVFDAIRAGNGKAADALWKSLPDFTHGENAIVVADVSGSMTGRPMDVSVSLALYFAERNTGPFKDYFLTFSERPELVHIKDGTLQQKLRQIQTANWGMNTDIQAVFNLLLKAALNNGAGTEDMPKVVYIISDMQFDQSTRNSGLTAFENAKQHFAEAGFVLPHVVFWNVNAYGTDSQPATKNDGNVTLISGLSQSTFQYAVAGLTPYESMLKVLNSERYAQIVIE